MNHTITRLLTLTMSLAALTSYAQKAKENNAAYGKNLLTISPVAITEQGVAFGIGYEKALDEKGIINFSLPVFYTFDNIDESYNNSANYVHLYPGIKIYPTGAFGKVRYGIGPSLVAAYGKGGYYNNINTYYGTNSNDKHFILGVMVTNSLNINFTPKYYFSAELGLGISYINRVASYNDGVMQLGRMGFNFGYRF